MVPLIAPAQGKIQQMRIRNHHDTAGKSLQELQEEMKEWQLLSLKSSLSSVLEEIQLTRTPGGHKLVPYSSVEHIISTYA